jgi:hypothetical protein
MSNEKVFSLTEEPSLTKTGDIRNADVTLQLLEKHGHEFGSLTPEAERRLRKRLYWRLMTLLSAINIVLFVRHVPSNERTPI